MTLKRKSIFIILFFLLFVVTEAYGKESKKSKIVYIDFDDELEIKGKLLGPSLFSLFQKKRIYSGKLIKPRTDFLREMRETAEDIR